MRGHLCHRAGGFAARANLARTGPPAASREVTHSLAFPSAFAGRAVPPAGNQPAGHPAAALAARLVARAPKPDLDPRDLALADFGASRLHTGHSSTVGRRRPSGSFAAAFPVRHAYRARSRAVLAAWPGRFRAPATLVGFAGRPSQCCSAPAGDGALLVGASIPPAVSPPRPPGRFNRSGIRPGRAGRGSRVAAAPGVWPRGRSRAVDVVGPARAFVHRAGRSVRPGLPWAFAPLSGVRRRPLGPASRAVDARGLLGGCVVPSAGWDGATARALRRMTPGRRLFAPAVFPPGRSPRMRFSRRPPDVRPTVVGRVPCRVFFKDAQGVAGG